MMFRRVQARHYKLLWDVDVTFGAFNILIGPNASGKSTFLDVFTFLQDSLQIDVEHAVRKRGRDLLDLVWLRQEAEQGFELAVEMDIPENLQTDKPEYDRIRYELAVVFEGSVGLKIEAENLFFVDSQRTRREDPIALRPGRQVPKGYRKILGKSASGNDYYRSEHGDWNMQYRLAPRKLSLSGAPADTSRFPATLWFRQTLLENMQTLQLNSAAMRRPTPFDAPRTFQPDGSNLPTMVELLRQDNARFGWWLGHIQTIVEDIEDVLIELRSEDNARYLVLKYRNGLQAPAWLLSDGTLRLLALTLLAYLPSQSRTFLIEEPENGVHPRVIEMLYQSLSSVYDGQVLIATHSPLILGLAKPEDLLVFSKDAGGEARID